MNRAKGFSLIEVMFVVALIGVLVAVALPSYEQYIRRANRAAAQKYMLEVATRQEQYKLDKFQYADTEALLGLSPPSEVSGRYTFALSGNFTASPPTYVVTATAQGRQVADGGPLTLSNTGAKSPPELWK